MDPSFASKPARSLILVLWSVLASFVPARAWGPRGHQIVNAAAVENLPEPLRSYFRVRKDFVVGHSTDPDTLAWESSEERPHHYTEVEAYDRFPFYAFRKQFVNEQSGPTPLQLEHGDCVWQIDRCTLQLADALRRRRWDEANQAAVFVAHYACDLSQPLHTVVNSDGQLTHQRGIHVRFEFDLVNARGGGWVLEPRPAVNLTDLRARIFDEMLASYSYRNIIFAADHLAVFARSYEDPEYLSTFFNLTELMARKRLRAAVSFVSSLWYTAWVRAGKPDLGPRSLQGIRPGRELLPKHQP